MLRHPRTIIQARITEHFVTGHYNCAMIALTVLSEIFELPLSQQTIDAAQVLPGAGGVGNLCGFVSGGLMFIGAWGGFHQVPRHNLREMSQRYSNTILEQYGSLHCRDLLNDCASMGVAMLEASIPIIMEEIAKLNTS